jgi:SDR family mycofactocin-dependent oxidoreductase
MTSGQEHRGEVALITGAARGQGRSHAVALARAGASLVLVDAPEAVATTPYAVSAPEDLDRTAKEITASGARCLTFAADVRSNSRMHELVRSAVAEFGRLDIVLANAGVFSVGTVREMTEQQWREVIDVNLTGVFNTIQASLGPLSESPRGRIVAAASGMGRRGAANIAHYVASKWGVIGLVKSVAIEVAPLGVTCNAVLPTIVNTTMIHNEPTYKLFAPHLESPDVEDVKPAFGATNPMGVPWVEPSDITDAVMFLLSKKARHISGETLSISAGGQASNAT